MSLIHTARNPVNKNGLYEGKPVRLRDSEYVRDLYPATMHGVMLLGARINGIRYDVLCEDNHIRVVDLTDIEAA